MYIVDDDDGMLESMLFLMESMEIPSRQFSDPYAFIKALGSLQPGCVLTDLRMPTMSGLELGEALRSRDINWPVILMSAHLDGEISADAVSAGTIQMIEKPFTAARLKTVLRRAFSQMDGAATGRAASD